MLKLRFASVVALAAVGCGSVETQSAPLLSSSKVAMTIQISKIKEAKGSICLAVWSGKEGFPTDDTKAAAASCVKAEEGSVSIPVEVPYSSEGYAAVVFHDVNDNGKLDTGLFGVPTEPFGSSNNPTDLSAPTFESSRFFLRGSPHVEVINLRKLF